MIRLGRGAAAILVVFLAVVAVGAAMRAPDDPGALHAAIPEPAPADPPPPGSMGPLRVHEQNPRYFADKSGRPVYLTGSHVWWNRLDRTWKAAGCAGQAGPFDYDGYLGRLQRLGHNFVRLWTWELARWDSCGETVWAEPLPWARTGPGTALDGRPRFDLTRWDESFFRRLRDRVEAARARGIYVSVMLFEGWSLQFQDQPWHWNSHPFHPSNNVNGIDGDQNGDGRGLELHTLVQPAVTELQAAYVRRVVELLADLDNVLYEVANESHPQSFDWQSDMIDVVRRQDSADHPVGVTYHYEDTGRWPAAADWISPGGIALMSEPPPADGTKVVLLDTDHLCGVCADELFAWRALLRGHNPVYMDPFLERPNYEAARRSLGRTRRLADRIELRAAVPRPELSSTGYALSDPRREYVVLQPGRGSFTIDLRDATGAFDVRWIEVRRPRERRTGTVRGGAVRSFTAPFDGPAVLWLRLVSRP